MSDNLDLEYLQILRLIKPHIACITNNKYIELIKTWLEKLSNVKEEEKIIRNYYIVQLGHQIEEGFLREPFLNPPPCGRLKPLEDKSRKKREEDEDSWLDITDDGSALGMASGDASSNQRSNEEELDGYDAKIANLLHVIEELRMENTQLNQITDKCTNGSSCRDISSEIESMKDKLNDVLDMKAAIRNSRISVASEWQSSIYCLKKKLSVALKKNWELKNLISNLERRLQEAESKNTTSQQCALLSEIHKRELETLKVKQRNEIEDIENNYKTLLNEKHFEFNERYQKLNSWYDSREKQLQGETEKNLREYYEGQLDQVRASFEQEISRIRERKSVEATTEKQLEEEEKLHDYYKGVIEDMKAENEKQISFKDCEILRLENLLQEQCGRMQEEVETIRNQMGNEGNSNEEKVQFLQRCVLKMDRLYKKAEKEFSRNISKLQKELDMREKHNQIQLTTQRVSVISSCGETKQREIDDIVNNLEAKYRTLLIEQQTMAAKEKNKDMQTITDLREELSNK